MLSQILTIVVPTFDRPAECRRLVRYLTRAADPPSILVLDSSRPVARDANQRYLGELSPHVSHVVFDPAMAPFDKFREGTHQIATRYAMFCADDDVIFTETLSRLVEVLESGAAVAAHGRYLGFEWQREVQVTRMMNDGPSITGNSAIERICRFIAQYQGVTYAMTRTDVLKAAFDGAAAFPDILFRELITGALIAGSGAIARLPRFTHARRDQSSYTYAHWHPLEFAYRDPVELFKQARNAIQLLLGIEEAGQQVRNRRALELAFLAYLSANVSQSALQYATRSTLQGNNQQRSLAELWARHYSTGWPWLDRVRAMPLSRALRDRWLMATLRRQVKPILTNARRGPDIRTDSCAFDQQFIAAGDITADDLDAIRTGFAGYLDAASPSN